MVYSFLTHRRETKLKAQTDPFSVNGEKRRGKKEENENQREYRECELVVGESYRGGDATRHMGPISRKDHLLHPE